MKGYLLDTNVISEYSRKKSPDERLRKWVDAQNEDMLYLSVLDDAHERRLTVQVLHFAADGWQRISHWECHRADGR